MSESLSAQIDSVKDPIGFAGLAKLVSCIDGDLYEAENRAGSKSDVLAVDKHIVAHSKQSQSLNKNGRDTTGSLMPLLGVLLAVGIGIAVSSKDFSSTKSPGAGTTGQVVTESVAVPAKNSAAQFDPAPTQFNWDTTVSPQPVTPPPSLPPPSDAANDTGVGGVATQQLAAPNQYKATDSQRPTESKPKVATGAVLYSSEIQYCLAEKIRIEGGEGVLDAYVADEVDRFNSYVSDYNGRCGNFRYHRNAVDLARAAVEPFRDAYLAEGRRRFRK